MRKRRRGGGRGGGRRDFFSVEASFLRAKIPLDGFLGIQRDRIGHWSRFTEPLLSSCWQARGKKKKHWLRNLEPEGCRPF